MVITIVITMILSNCFVCLDRIYFLRNEHISTFLQLLHSNPVRRGQVVKFSF